MCVLVEGNRQSILGLKACENFGLIQRVNVVNSKAVTQSDTVEKQNEMVTILLTR